MPWYPSIKLAKAGKMPTPIPGAVGVLVGGRVGCQGLPKENVVGKRLGPRAEVVLA